MRLEEFDKQFQQKLEELKPVFNEQDWIRLSQKMKDQKSPVLYYKRIGLILLLLFLVLFGTWMSFRWSAIMHGEENSKGVEKDQMPVKMAEATEYQINNHSDNKFIANENPNKTLPFESNTTDLSTKSRIKSERIASFKNVQNGFIKNGAVKKNLNGNQTILNKSTSVEYLASAETSHVNNDQSSENSEANESMGIVQNKIEYNVLANQGFENANMVFSTVEPIQILPTASVSINKKPSLSSHLKATTGVKPNKWIVGATGLFTSTHLNTGLAFEIKTNKNISFSSGLVLQNYFKQNYIDQKDFAATTEADFTDLIRPRNSNSQSYKNIQIKSSDFILPLILKYYYPLNFKYALFASAGIQLTLYSKTTVGFEYLPYDTNKYMKESDLSQASNSSTLINNFILSAGIQREFGKLVLQTSFALQKNKTNQPQISKLDPAGQLGIFYKL